MVYSKYFFCPDKKKKKTDRDLGCIRGNKMDLVTPSMSLLTAEWLVLLHLEQVK